MTLFAFNVEQVPLVLFNIYFA